MGPCIIVVLGWGRLGFKVEGLGCNTSDPFFRLVLPRPSTGGRATATVKIRSSVLFCCSRFRLVALKRHQLQQLCL